MASVTVSSRFAGRGLTAKRLAISALACALLIVGISSAISLFQFARKAAVTETFGFPAAYSASRLVALHDRSGNLQDWDWFRAQTRRFGFKATDVFYGNPPSAALVMLPIAALPPGQARVVWTWFTLALWIFSAGLLGSRLITSEAASPWIVAPALLCLATLYAPFRANVEEGQTYVFAFALQSACCWFWLRQQPTMAGAFGGALLACKGYGLPFMIFAVLRRDWAFCKGALTSFGLLALISGWALGFKQWLYFFSTYRGTSFSGIPTPALQTVKSALALILNLPTIQAGPLRLLSPSSDHLLFGIEVAATVVCLLWLSRGRGRPSASALSACVLVNLAFSPRAEEHSYPLAMTALLLLLPESRKQSVSAWLVILGGVLLSWPFHLQDRTPLTGTAAIPDFARLWGGVLLLVAALLAESRYRPDLRLFREQWVPAYVAGVLTVGLVLYYVKPWRNPIRSGPLLAVSQSDENAITLLRLDVDEREVATVPLHCKGPFGLAFVQRISLYSACWNDSKISILDLKQVADTNSVSASKLPAWVANRESGDEVWISNEDRGTVSVYGARTGRFLTEVATGKGPSDILFTEEGKRAWTSNEGGGTISVLDGDSRAKTADIQVGQVPQGIALTTDGKYLLVANFGSNTVSLVDTAHQREAAQIAVCRGPVDVTASSADSGIAFVSCYSGGLVGVVDVHRGRQIQEIVVGDKPFGIAASSSDRRIFVCVGGSNRLVILDGKIPSRIVRRIVVPGTPLQLAVAP